jgi:hypothetical protein
MRGATFDGNLNMNGLDVAQHLAMGAGAKFKDVEFTNARVGGHLHLSGATFEGHLNMSGLDVTQDLLMAMGARFKGVELKNARVGGQLRMEGANFDGNLNLDSLLVEGDVFLGGSTFKETVCMVFAQIGRSLELSNSELTGLDLSCTRIEGELRLGSDQHPRTRWLKDSCLNLRNVHAGALQDRRDRVAEQRKKRRWWRQRSGDREPWEDAWPAELQLDGFTYDRLGGFGGAPERVEDSQCNCDVDMQARDIHWYIDWLARDHSYSPQPYEQLASVFHAAGDPAKSNRILYESRRRARTEAWHHARYERTHLDSIKTLFRWLGDCLLDWTIGYGLGGRYFRALGWVIAFTTGGAAILYFSGQPDAGLASGLLARLVYSLDQLLPIVEFEKYDQVKLTGGVACYFYFQKLVGWALGSFLVAGLAGLTQKR